VPKYNFYDLPLDSEVVMPELPLATLRQGSSISIKWGEVTRPVDDMEGAHYKPDSVSHSDFYFLEVDDIAKYYIKGKESIVIERLGQSGNRDVIAFLIDTVLTVLLLKHDKFVFHASAVAGPEGAVMICGRAGVGKSSIALRLLDKGYTFIEDDRCLLYWNEEDNRVYLKNYLPFVDVWSNEAKKVDQMKGAKVMHPVRDNIAKLRVDIRDYVSTESLPLDKVITMTINNDDESPKVKIITGMAKVRWAKAFTHMDHLIPHINDASNHFAYMMKILSSIPMIRVTRTIVARPGQVADFLNDEIIVKDTHEIIETIEE